MSDEKNTVPLTALLSILPVMLVFSMDYWLMGQAGNLGSHFAFAVLVTQLLCQIAFFYGEICQGQRGRLAIVNLCWLGFWGGLFAVNWLLATHSLLLYLLVVCGSLLTLSGAVHRKNEVVRTPFLIGGFIVGGAGLILYLVMLFGLSDVNIVRYNLISQIFTAILLAYLALIISRNRLQGFIALMPMSFIAVLLLNAVVILIWAGVMHFSGATLQSGLAVYFVLHLILSAVFMQPILRQTKLSYTPLVFALCVALSLPVFISVS
ncbi:hypothetical protein EDC44_1014 [Cricetibacter osteomyelitidis]|uniref:Uncharacterized protein n=1 Tax=Cricetibacter osteomyelitidis TaxID=1521931 RepID=A0A4V2T2J4_9PAST|nr:hypothetical protein [Cricetibacter osteomyelitidis]TCP97623.1 hypothetical protein EDC44_1014 [Cricetibacter osteomyelitidis]